MVNKTYIPSNLCDSSDGRDSCDSSDSSDSVDSSDQNNFFLSQKKRYILFFL